MLSKVNEIKLLQNASW